MEQNDVGDLVLDDPAATRALAHPERLSLLDRLRRGGPATADELGEGAAAHLAELGRFGFVTHDGATPPRWTAVGKGVYFEIPDDPEGQAAARELTRVMLLHYEHLPRQWVEQSEPALTVDWARAAGLFNARVTLTAAELAHLQEELEHLLAPYTSRDEQDVPAEAEPVRILAYFLPEAGSRTRSTPSARGS